MKVSLTTAIEEHLKILQKITICKLCLSHALNCKEQERQSAVRPIFYSAADYLSCTSIQLKVVKGNIIHMTIIYNT